MRLEVPSGTLFYWNPYSPKLYTIVSSSSSSNDASSDEGTCPGSFAVHDEVSKTRSPSFAAPEDDEFDLGWAAIATVRVENSDAQLKAAMQRLPRRSVLAMLHVLEATPGLMLELCFKERGNIISHLVEILGGARTQSIIRCTIDNLYDLATNQSGCLAVTRIFDAASGIQQGLIAATVLQHFRELATHPYGNFVASRILQAPISEDVHAEVASLFIQDPKFLLDVVSNKCGSHVFENLVNNTTEEFLFAVCSALLHEDIIVMTAQSKIANYPLQAALRRMLAVSPAHELSQWAVQAVPTLVAGSTYALNINRALGLRMERPRE